MAKFGKLMNHANCDFIQRVNDVVQRDGGKDFYINPHSFAFLDQDQKILHSDRQEAVLKVPSESRRTSQPGLQEISYI